MKYKYVLPDKWVNHASGFREFKSGAMQVSIKLKNQKVFEKVLISNCRYIVAIRNFRDLPFRIDEISDIFQSKEDENPVERGNWLLWDEWSLGS